MGVLIIKKKLRQINDNIHGTIYLSELESKLMSTPFFYRLNDIYQSSTVYLTFPSNRTKRFEHSLGVMHLTSKMFFYAIANSDTITNKTIFDQLSTDFETIKEGIQLAVNCNLYKSIGNDIDELLEQNKDQFSNEIGNALKDGILEDLALDHYMPNCFHSGNASDSKAKARQVSMRQFVYRCILQSVRIAALFHDVGHPPYSHILEEVIEMLYARCKKNDEDFNEKKVDKLKSSLKPYMQEGDNAFSEYVLCSDIENSDKKAQKKRLSRKGR